MPCKCVNETDNFYYICDKIHVTFCFTKAQYNSSSQEDILFVFFMENWWLGQQLGPHIRML